MALDHSRCSTTQITGWLGSIANVVVSAVAIQAVGGVPVTLSIGLVEAIDVAIGVDVVAIGVDGVVFLRWRSNLFIFGFVDVAPAS